MAKLHPDRNDTDTTKLAQMATAAALLISFYAM